MKRILLLPSIIVALLFFSETASAQLGKCKGKYLGNIVAYSVQSNYTQLWNQTTSENGLKWGSCDRGSGRYDFGNSDLAFNTAKNSGGLFKFHALIWGAQAPGYLKDAPAATIETAIRNWYKAVEDHYKPMGGLNFIDVLNEPVNTPINREITNLKAALTLGYQNEAANANDRNNPYGWAIWPFQLARKHFPNAVLLINEFNTEHNWNNCRAEYIKMSNAIKNAPNLTDGRKNIIDGIGLQAHGMNGQLNLSAANFKACLDEIWNKTNLPLHITELDLVAEPNEQAQRTKYEEFFTIAWEHPRVAGITLWGYVQGATWIPGNRVSGPGGTDSGIQYSNLTDRPAMTWLKQYMASRPSLSCCPAPAPFGACNGSNPPTVTITSPSNNAAFTSGTTIDLTATATDADGTVSNVKFYDGTTLLSTDNSSPYSYSWTNASLGSHTVKAVATDNSGNTTEVSIIIKVNVPQGPFNNTAHPIPGIIQAEQFDKGGNGIAYSDDSPGSAVTPVVNYRTDEDVDIETCTDAGGGYNIGWWTAGEYLEYTVNVAATDEYIMELRVACEGAGRTVTVAMGNTALATNFAIPNTGGWQTWATAKTGPVALTAGQHVLRITAGTQSYINFNYIEFKPVIATGLENEENADFTLFPNPFTSEGLQIGGSVDRHYKITNLSGAVVEQGKAKNSQRIGQGLQPGVYFLSIDRNNATSTYKIVRQ